jgi:MYXO-CTERM domain-containing protein
MSHSKTTCLQYSISAAAGLLLSTSLASASIAGPDLEVAWTVDGSINTATLVGTDLGGGLFSYAALTSDTGYAIDWEMTVNNNGGSGGFEVLSSTLGVSNLGFADSAFELSILLPTAFGSGSALYGGSVGGSITGDENGGYIGTLGPDLALWTGFVDGVQIASMIDAPFFVETDPFGSASIPADAFGEPIPSLPGASPLSSMAIEIDFILGGGDTASLTSTFVAQVPTPATLALFGVAGLGRRRRRH